MGLGRQKLYTLCVSLMHCRLDLCWYNFCKIHPSRLPYVGSLKSNDITKFFPYYRALAVLSLIWLMVLKYSPVLTINICSFANFLIFTGEGTILHTCIGLLLIITQLMTWWCSEDLLLGIEFLILVFLSYIK